MEICYLNLADYGPAKKYFNYMPLIYSNEMHPYYL